MQVQSKSKPKQMQMQSKLWYGKAGVANPVNLRVEVNCTRKNALIHIVHDECMPVRKVDYDKDVARLPKELATG